MHKLEEDLTIKALVLTETIKKFDPSNLSFLNHENWEDKNHNRLTVELNQKCIWGIQNMPSMIENFNVILSKNQYFYLKD